MDDLNLDPPTIYYADESDSEFTQNFEQTQNTPSIPNIDGIDDDYTLRAVFDCFLHSSHVKPVFTTSHQNIPLIRKIKQLSETAEIYDEKLHCWTVLYNLIQENEIYNENCDEFDATGFFENLNWHFNSECMAENGHIFSFWNGQHSLITSCSECKTVNVAESPFFFVQVPVSKKETYQEELEENMEPRDLSGLISREDLYCECEKANPFKFWDHPGKTQRQIHKYNDLMVLSSLEPVYSQHQTTKPFPKTLDSPLFWTYKLKSFVLYTENGFHSVLNTHGEWILSNTFGAFIVTERIDELLADNVRLAFYDKEIQ